MQSNTPDQIRHNIVALYGDPIEKSEGSRGGKVVGHTKSGKPIYDHYDHPEHKNFSIQDHEDARSLSLKRNSQRDAGGHALAGDKKHQEVNDKIGLHKMSGEELRKEATRLGVEHFPITRPQQLRNKIAEKHSQIQKSEEDTLEKGEKKPAKSLEEKNKKIGKTRSGKDVFSHVEADGYEDFDANDHRDAGDLHHAAAAKGDGAFPGHHRAMRNKHTDIAIKATQKAEKEKLKAQPGAGDIITTKEGIGGSVKHRDDTHTYVEYDHEADGKKMKKISKIKNEDVDSKIAAGHYAHHKPTNVKKDDIKKGEESEIEKAGEGSKGGRVIGHTKNGKPIYALHKDQDTKGWTQGDHSDAEHYWKEKGNAERGKFHEEAFMSKEGSRVRSSSDGERFKEVKEKEANSTDPTGTKAFLHNHSAASKEQREHVADQYFGDKNKDLTKVGSHHHAQLGQALYDKVKKDREVKKGEDPLNVIKSHQSEVCKQIVETFSKGGEGSGKYMHHSSGKSILQPGASNKQLEISNMNNEIVSIKKQLKEAVEDDDIEMYNSMLKDAQKKLNKLLGK